MNCLASETEGLFLLKNLKFAMLLKIEAWGFRDHRDLLWSEYN